uniref:RING finger protein Z n=1 Tax=Mammarenavirus lassaense TaxID=3052310 RepID=E9K9R8_LASV|nr:Z protein [Mammarenavirus lassaense]
MGGKHTKQPRESNSPRASLIPDATHLGPQFCKSCWFENKGLVECNNHYLCLNCLSLLLSVSNRCPICKMPLPTRLRTSTNPTAPQVEQTGPASPPPYSP